MDPTDEAIDFESGDVVHVVEYGEYVHARDQETGVTSQGPTKADALENLGASLRSYLESVEDESDDGEWLG